MLLQPYVRQQQPLSGKRIMVEPAVPRRANALCFSVFLLASVGIGTVQSCGGVDEPTHPDEQEDEQEEVSLPTGSLEVSFDLTGNGADPDGLVVTFRGLNTA